MKRYIAHIVVFMLIGFVISELSEYFVVSLAGNSVADDNPISQDSMKIKVLMGIIIGPLVETFLFQHSVLNFTRNLFDEYPLSYVMPIFFSSLIFAIVHLFSIYYVIDAFIMGMWFAFSYLYILDKFGSKMKAFMVPWITHLALNTIAILF